MSTRRPTVVFVNFNCADQIEPKAADLVEHGLGVVVADNSGEYRGPGTIVPIGENIGFGPACNRGMDRVETATFCLHNPDVELDIELLAQLTDTIETTPAEIVAPALETPQGVIRNGYGYPSLLRQARTLSKLRSKKHVGPEPDREAQPEPSRSGYLYQRARSAGSNRFGSGALLVGDTGAFQAVGGFDDRYVLYGEDLDLWHRYGLSGSPGVFRNDLVAAHERGGGSPTTRPVRELLRLAGVETFVQLHGRRSQWRPYRRMHRSALHWLSDGGSVAALLEELWGQSLQPVEVAAELRAAFHQGIMSPPPGPEDG